MGKLAIPQSAFDGAIKFFDSATDKDGKVWLHAPGARGTLVIDGRDFSDLPDWTAAAGLCRIFCGQKRSLPVLQKAAAFCANRKPEWKKRIRKKPEKYAEEPLRPAPKEKVTADEMNFHYWYFGTYFMFQMGGKEWRHWNNAMKRALLKSQRVGRICQDGSWDPVGVWAKQFGRTGTTAINTLTLEIYYRYARANIRSEKEKEKETPKKDPPKKEPEPKKPGMIQLLLQGKESLARTRDVYALEDIVISSKETLRTRVCAAAALAMRGNKAQDSAGILGDCLQDKEPVIRAAIAHAFGEIGGDVAKKALEDALKNEKNTDVRAVIAKSIKNCESMRKR